MTEQETRRYTNAMRLPLPRAYPMRIDSFQSVSPIHFHAVEELEAKLSRMKPKKGNAPYDTSQANRGYTDSNPEPGLKRGHFEHNRVLYRILQRTLDLPKYSVPADTRWTQNLRICSLVYNLWSLDHRAVSDRRRAPRLLDVGFAEARVPDLEYKPGTGVHLSDERNLGLKQGAETTREAFRYGDSHTMSQDQIGDKLRELLRLDPRQPTILLIMGEDWTTDILGSLGVFFHVEDIRSLIYGSRRDTHQQSSSRHNDYDSRRDRRRSRSRSPQRSYAASSDPRRRPDTRDIPSTERDRPRLYVIDVKELYLTMMEESEIGTYSVSQLAERLGHQVNHLSWCAGNEAVQLIQLWKDMISGAAIDEQRELRRDTVTKAQNVFVPPEERGKQQNGASAAAPDTQDDDGDDSDDPNNWQAPPPKPGVATIDPDEFSDYGSDSEED
ncbi:hypothetical protein CC1G_03298 [Coprinopsis cinerea okayama7|uniref:Uncharacterized protein n=1 Tax=Coprinopsis cinerea (strain Okayama-7 / 130 / ATCC MYA-4618 / FGSC 9003) TaxID=240176 RepID=A8N7F5_COPC7|nr:hypothetical protein CC1G_03298 [Coprinopsis cinerea okayama7\|eukprot:XP_001830761.2 hypothetical protein CC1G_03298 [Coprinopsis cinerea okayama7\